MRLYSDLAPWFHLLTSPEDYAEEAGFYTKLIRAVVPEATTLLELGSGGGNNASHMKAGFTCTLSDLSADMLALSRELNPECEHIQGDMRTVRLGRTFDAVFIHDAIDYMTTEKDLAAAIETAFAHTRPGGVAVFVPDAIKEEFEESTDTGGHDGDGRSLRYLEWSFDPDPHDTTYDYDFAIMIREEGKPLEVVHDHQVVGLFDRHTWLRLIRAAGFRVEVVDVADPYEGEHFPFVAQRPG